MYSRWFIRPTPAPPLCLILHIFANKNLLHILRCHTILRLVHIRPYHSLNNIFFPLVNPHNFWVSFHTLNADTNNLESSLELFEIKLLVTFARRITTLTNPTNVQAKTSPLVSSLSELSIVFLCWASLPMSQSIARAHWQLEHKWGLPGCIWQLRHNEWSRMIMPLSSKFNFQPPTNNVGT